MRMLMSAASPVRAVRMAICLLMLLFASSSGTATSVATKRHVRWYMASGADMDVDLNNRWLANPVRCRPSPGG